MCSGISASGEESAAVVGRDRTHGIAHGVHEALDYVDQHLCEPDMTVAKIAKALEMNPTYLAHLFAEHVEVRTSRYIAMRRIELAKKLLDTTNWQIKRVAHESGHANADWFSQVFRAQTGLTPRDYRRRALLA